MNLALRFSCYRLYQHLSVCILIYVYVIVSTLSFSRTKSAQNTGPLIWKRQNPSTRWCWKTRQRGEQVLMGFTGLKTYPNNITSSQAGGWDWKKIRQKWEDEEGTKRLRGWVRLRHKNRYRMWRKGRREERPRSFKSLWERVCVCVCAFVPMQAHGAPLFPCVCD